MFGFPFEAEIIDDSIYYMGEEHALGHMAVELMNSIGDSDLLLHVTAARFPIEQALDAMQMSSLDEAPFTAVRQYLLWQLEALAQLPPFRGMDTAAEQAQITELFSPEIAKQIQAWQKLQAELTASNPTEAQIRHILSLPNAPDAHPGKALFDAATEYLRFCLELLDDLADADWCFRPFIRCVNDLESFKVDKLAGLAGKLFRKTGFSARTEYEIRTYEDDDCDVVRIMEFSNYRSLLMTDFFEGIQWNHYPRRCPVCGRVFLMEKAYHQKYCTGNAPLELTGGRVFTCADWALRKESGFQKEAAEASEVKRIYTNTTGSIRKYKSLGTITAEQSEAAKRLAEEKRDEAIRNKEYAAGAYPEEMIYSNLMEEVRNGAEKNH